MKLLFVTREDHAERRYGLGRSLLPLASALERRGHAVRYLCRADRSARSAAVMARWQRRLGSAARPWWREGEAFLGAFLERLDMGRLAARVAARDGYTHVHLHDPWLGYGYRLFARVHGARARWGVTEHGYGCYSQAVLEDGLQQGPRLMRRLRRLEASVLARADWVVAPTRAALAQLARDLCLAAVPAHWHAVPHARPQLKLLDRATARERLRWAPTAFYVLGIGRLVPLKRFRWLIDAVTGISGDVRLVLLGDGDAAGLRRHAAAVGLRHPLEICTTDDVGLYLSAADIYVSASSSESFGLANLEALAAGVPSVCTAVGGVPEVVGEAAWLVPPDPDALRAAVAALAADPRLQTHFATRGRARAAHWPDIDSIAERYERLYLDSARRA